MNIQHLKVGAKLMWDAPEPYEGYAKQVYGRDDGRVKYPAVIIELRPDREMSRVRTSNKSNWMGYEQEWLREPTQEELDTLQWPEAKPR